MLKIVKEGSECRVELFQVNRLNTLFSELVKEQLKELVEEPGISVIFNLEGIRFIDTSGFGVLLAVTDHARLCGSEFKLCNLTDDVKELMVLLELEEELAMCTCAPVQEKILQLLD
ncbi:MAG: anti-sigma factor antagonist [Bacteroidia bacterium]|nr:MAG: anti-sigma factor antagonist [Bacteroidia bacterium]